MNNEPFCVLIVEDSPAWRAFIRSTIEQHLPSALVSEVADGVEAVQKAADLHPGLITLDIGLPKLNGIEAARQMGRESPGSRILFVTQEQSPEFVEEALATGGLGYVLKSDGAEILLDGVNTIMRGGRYISPSLRMRTTSRALSFEVTESGH